MSEHDRYHRQQNAFPHERRTQTFIADLGGRGAPLTSAFHRFATGCSFSATVAISAFGPPSQWAKAVKRRFYGHSGLMSRTGRTIVFPVPNGQRGRPPSPGRLIV